MSVCVCVKQFMLVVQNVKHVNQKSFARRAAYHGAYEFGFTALPCALVAFSNAHTDTCVCVCVLQPAVAATAAVARQLHDNFESCLAAIRFGYKFRQNFSAFEIGNIVS